MEQQKQEQKMTPEEIQAMLTLPHMEKMVTGLRKEGWPDEEIAEAIRDS